MRAGYAKWIPMGLLGLGLASTPALAHEKHHDRDDEDDVSVRYYHPSSHGREHKTYTYTYRPSYRTYGYVEPSYRSYGYVEGEDYTTPENAWWHDYEAMNEGRWQGERQYQTGRQYYGYSEPSAVTLRGTIVELREFRSSEWNRPHLVAFVQSEDGNTQRVVLGPTDRVGDLDIRVGDRITVSGTPRAIEGIQSVVARRFDTPGAHWTGREYTAQPSGQWYHGEVRDDDHEEINGVTHTLARVKLDNGDHIQVDLGPTDALPKIDLDHGDDIAFFGPTGSLKGKTTVFADEFRWNGRSFVLNRQGGPLQLETEVHAYR